MTKILVFAGSTRKQSLNRQLAKQAAHCLHSLGAEATYIDLADYEMPIYQGDLEEASGLPEAAKRLKQLFVEHDGFVIASPEYNSSFAPVLKNALDWISRKSEENEPALVAYQGKKAALLAASPGGFGGLRGLVPLRMMLGNIGVWVAPQQLAIAQAHEAFDAEGSLSSKAHQAQLKAVMQQLL